MSAYAPTIAPRARDEDADGALGDVGSPPTDDDSVVPEAKGYIEGDDRLYHANWAGGRYPLPNHEQEQERLGVWHEVLLSADGLYRVTLPKGPPTCLMLER